MVKNDQLYTLKCIWYSTSEDFQIRFNCSPWKTFLNIMAGYLQYGQLIREWNMQCFNWIRFNLKLQFVK